MEVYVIGHCNFAAGQFAAKIGQENCRGRKRLKNRFCGG